MFSPSAAGTVFQGQFGEFTITKEDCQGVRIYRGALIAASICFSLGSFTLLFQGSQTLILNLGTILYCGFTISLAIALWHIHIYLKILHNALKVFWMMGSLATIGVAYIAWQNHSPLLLYIYENPVTIWGVGFTFVALTGVYFKEAFCFNQLETKLLVPIVPILLIGHLSGSLPIEISQIFLASWCSLFMVFGLRKIFQDIPTDIGDKSVFDYLEKLEKTHGTPS